MTRTLRGQSTVLLGSMALVAWTLYRYAVAQGDHELKWRVPLDLKIYALAGRDVAAGGLLYDKPYLRNLPFTYPPFAGVLFTGLAGMSHDVLIGVWQVGTALALWAVILLSLHSCRVRLTPVMILTALFLTVASLGLAPISGTVFFGQINVLLMLLVSLDLLPRRWRLPGIGIGLAAGLKLTPAYLVLVLLFQRRWWSVLGALLTFLATVAAGYMFIPDAQSFWTDAIFKSQRVGVHNNPGAMALRSVLERLFDIPGGPVWIASIVAVVLLNCACVALAISRGNTAVAMAFTGLGACLISPFSWYHHFVWLVPLAVAMLVRANRYLGERLPGQLAGLISLAAVAVTMVPWVSKPLWYHASFFHLDDYQPWGALVFPFSVVAYMLIYVIYGLATRKGSRSRPVTRGRLS